MVELTSTASCAVIEAMKNIFSRYAIPETLTSDNGLQFSATEMKDFLIASDFSMLQAALITRKATAGRENCSNSQTTTICRR